MAAEYEISELGFIGSFWQGNFGTATNVGKTLEVANVPGVIEYGGRERNLANSSVAIYFTEMDLATINSDIQRLNSYLPSNLYFELGSLPPNVLDDLATGAKINRQFLSDNNRVLFRFDKNAPGRTYTYSRIPVDFNWSFDTSNPDSPKFLSTAPSTPYISYTFIVDMNVLETYRSYFASIDSSQTELLSVGASPFNNSRFNRDIRGGILDPNIRRLPVNPLLAKIGLSDNVSELNVADNGLFTDTLNLPPKPPEPKVYTFPAVDPDLMAEERAAKLFSVNKSIHVITTLTQFNEQLLETQGKRKVLFQKMQNRETINDEFDVPFTEAEAFEIRVQYKYWGFVENYLYEQIAQLNNVSVPTVDPTNWEVLDDGTINVMPPPPEIPRDVVATAVEDRKDLDEFDSLIDEMIDDLTIDDNNIYAFKKVTKVADYALPILRYKTRGLFKCTGEKLSTFHTGSTLTSKQQKYYLSVYNEPQGGVDSYHQFDVSYCHINGAGSSQLENEIDLLPAKAMYRKYMLECFGHTNGKFPFKNGKNGDYFYVIQLDRTAYQEKLDSGNFEIALCELSSSGTVTHPTSTKLFTLIDESKDTKQEIVTNEGIQEYYFITSGSLRDGVYDEPDADAWGIVFPKMGLIVLDGVVLDQSCSFSTITGSTDGQNAKRLFLSISGAAVPTAYRPSSSFFARSFETYLTETYFCRADFNEFNHSTNYTYTTGSGNFLKYDYFSKDPRAYVTTVGLYNKNKELLAVGKLRNPIQKNDGRVCIFEVVVRLN
jgi:hypothetical protein